MSSASGGLSPPDQGLCPWTPLGALPPDLRYRLALDALAIGASRPPYSSKFLTRTLCISSSNCKLYLCCGCKATATMYFSFILTSSVTQYTHTQHNTLPICSEYMASNYSQKFRKSKLTHWLAYYCI